MACSKTRRSSALCGLLLLLLLYTGFSSVINLKGQNPWVGGKKEDGARAFLYSTPFFHSSSADMYHARPTAYIINLLGSTRIKGEKLRLTEAKKECSLGKCHLTRPMWQLACGSVYSSLHNTPCILLPFILLFFKHFSYKNRYNLFEISFLEFTEKLSINKDAVILKTALSGTTEQSKHSKSILIRTTDLFKPEGLYF